MQYNFDEIISRAGTNAEKYEGAHLYNPYLSTDFIPLWVADMDFACAPPILDAMRRRLDRRILGYSTVVDAGYFDAVTGWMQRRFHWQIERDWIVFSAGIVAALYAAVDTTTSPGDEVLMMTPTYAPFCRAAKQLGRIPVFSRLLENGGFYTVDWEDFAAKAARPDCRLFFLCSPHNPTGRVWTREELLRIGTICFENQVLIVADEIHADLLRAGVGHTPLAGLFAEQPRIITCTSPSKTFNIAGNRHANIIIADEALRRSFSASAYCGHVGALAIEATKAAYNECEEWLEQLRVYLDGNFAFLAEALAGGLPKAVFRTSEGTYLSWVNLSALNAAEDALNHAVSGAGVYVQFGKDFVDNGDCHARINLACPRSVLAKGLERMCGALRSF